MPQLFLAWSLRQLFYVRRLLNSISLTVLMYLTILGAYTSFHSNIILTGHFDIIACPGTYTEGYTHSN